MDTPAAALSPVATLCKEATRVEARSAVQMWMRRLLGGGS